PLRCVVRRAGPPRTEAIGIVGARTGKRPTCLWLGRQQMANAFDPEEALARWKALEEEKWRGLDAYRASWKADDISGQEKLRLVKDWMTRVNEAQAEERARLLKQIRTAKLNLQKTTDGWRLVPMPPWLEEDLRDAEEDEAEDADAQRTD